MATTAADIRGPWHDNDRVSLTTAGRAVVDPTRENVRRIIEALRLGESFDLYRELAELGHEAAPTVAETIADAFVCAAAWNDEDACDNCGASLTDGEGYDGRCGTCADRADSN